MPECQEPIDVLVVLQGAADTALRCRVAVEYIDDHPEVRERVIISGNVPQSREQQALTPGEMAFYITSHSYASGIQIDRNSYNTGQHPDNVHGLIQGMSNQLDFSRVIHVGLITSETHAERAYLTFCKKLKRWPYCWHMIPSPPYGDPELERAKIREYGLNDA